MKIQASVLITLLAILSSSAMEKPPAPEQVKQFQPLSLQQLTMRPIIKNIVTKSATVDEAINGINAAAAKNIQIRNLLDDGQVTNDIIEQLYDKFGAIISPDTHYAYIDIAARLNTQGAREWYKLNNGNGFSEEDKILANFHTILDIDFRSAVRRNNLILFDFLVKHFGAGLDFSDLVGDAAKNGSVEMVKRLLAQGADPNGKPGAILRPLDRAIMNNKFEIAKILLEAGANPQFLIGEQDPATKNKIIQLLKPVYPEK